MKSLWGLDTYVLILDWKNEVLADVVAEVKVVNRV